MKAILIARVSTEERDVRNSLSAQIARLEHYCQNKNFKFCKYAVLMRVRILMIDPSLIPLSI